MKNILGIILAAAAGLAGCATPGGLPAGTSIDTARRGLWAPSGEYALPGGGRRLEFVRGAFGKETWMLDFDAKGLLVASEQVLTPQNLATIQPGMSAEEVRMRFGRPAQVFRAGWVDHYQVWNYRFFDGDCVWYQVSIRDADRRVSDAGIGQDPACDARDARD